MSTSPATRAQRRLKARILFRLAAVVIGLSPLLVAELICRANGWGLVEEASDPFVGFAAERPLFALNEATKRYEIARSRQAYFRPDSFAADKGEREFRIFCLGGSTVQGRPYAIETSFTTWLELSLHATDDRRDWKVVNCGGISYASYRLAPIMRELLAYQPDLFVVYTGHNEFLEDRAYQSVKQTPQLIARLHGWSSRWQFYNLCRLAWLSRDAANHVSSSQQVAVQPGVGQAQLSLEVDALLDYRGGLDDYHRDDAWHRDVAAHYEFNLHRMVVMARQANVPLLLVNPTSNLKDCPPFKFTNLETLSPMRRSQFEQLWEQAKDERQLDRRADLLRQAIALDDRHAGAHYLLGNTLLSQRRPALARQALVRAVEEDVCPLRMTTPLYAALARVANQTRTPLVDVRALFDSRVPNQITGDEMLLDHIHPTISGHQLIADALLEQMVAERLITPRANREAARKLRFREHLATLDAIYYARGKQRLEGLIRWTQGRADKLKPTSADERVQDDVEPVGPAAPNGADTSDQNAGSRSAARAPGNGESGHSAPVPAR
ncbi:MAG: hypothetical protein QF918_04840 [Pirellulaceae bacterium]|jgi:hypothetical protein|nr:hypothetical protein [Pirellulaceae bacterium]MDP6554141.1 hypothetical protein [Pirellulaceae bacterium]